MDQVIFSLQSTFGAGIVGVVAYAGIHVVGNTFGPEPVSMSVKHLRYSDGEFDQWIAVEGGPVQADWAAKITRASEDGVDRFLCVGGGRSIYTGAPSPRMDPSFWTGDDCPEILPGDRAHASWEYRDADGTIHRISAEIVIRGEMVGLIDPE